MQTTATKAMELNDKARGDSLINHLLEHFLREYGPLAEDRVRFEMDLMALVRALHVEAVRPYEEILKAGLQMASFQSIIKPNT